MWDPDFWVNLAMRKADDFGNVVITDVRFPNEYNAIKYRNGHVWRVNKLNHKPANDHPSEIALDDFEFDWSIPNYGTIEDLHAVIDGIMKS